MNEIMKPRFYLVEERTRRRKILWKSVAAYREAENVWYDLQRNGTSSTIIQDVADYYKKQNVEIKEDGIGWHISIISTGA